MFRSNYSKVSVKVASRNGMTQILKNDEQPSQQDLDNLLAKEREKHRLELKKLENTNQELVEECDQLKRKLIDFMNEASKNVKDLTAKWKSQLEMCDETSAVTGELQKIWKDLIILRSKNSEVMNKMLKDAQKNGKSFPWQFCEICLEKFSSEENHVPRILNCGHTMCHGCVKKLVCGGVKKIPSGVTCPFDRIRTEIKESIEESVAKNFTVLAMCS